MEWIRLSTTILNLSQLIRLIGTIPFWSNPIKPVCPIGHNKLWILFPINQAYYDLIDLFVAWTVCCVNAVITIGMILSNSYFLLTRQRNSCFPFVLIIIDFTTIGFDGFWNELIDCVIFTKSGYDSFEWNDFGQGQSVYKNKWSDIYNKICLINHVMIFLWVSYGLDSLTA